MMDANGSVLQGFPQGRKRSSASTAMMVQALLPPSDPTVVWQRFKQSTECHAVVTELRILSNNLVAIAEIQNCRKLSGLYIIWHFPS